MKKDIAWTDLQAEDMGDCIPLAQAAARARIGMLLVGPPGAEKTMMARRLTLSMEPPCQEALNEITAIHKSAGLISPDEECHQRPFRAPHHTCSERVLIGGRIRGVFGEIHLAQEGILYLDEITEFGGASLRSLSSTLQRGTMRAAIPGGAIILSVLLVGSCSPCPCGYYGSDEISWRRCNCNMNEIVRYWARLSPILQFMPLTIQVPACTPQGGTP